MTRILDCMMGALKQDPLLRIHHLGFGGCYCKEAIVEAIRILQHPRPAETEIIRVHGSAPLLPTRRWDAVNAIATVPQVVPEFSHIGGLRITPSHAYNRKLLRASGFSGLAAVRRLYDDS